MLNETVFVEIEESPSWMTFNVRNYKTKNVCVRLSYR